MSKAPRTGEAYALQIPKHCTVSIRGVQLAVQEYTEFYERRPEGIMLTEEQFCFLCREAERSGRTFMDAVPTAGELPTFMGIPMGLAGWDERLNFEPNVVRAEEA